MDFCFLPTKPSSFLSLYRGSNAHIGNGDCAVQQLALNREISTIRWHMISTIRWHTFPPIHISSSLDMAVIPKPMFVQERLFCTSSLSSNTNQQQDFVIIMIRFRVVDDEYFASLALYIIFSVAVVMSEINPTESYWLEERPSPCLPFSWWVCESVAGKLISGLGLN